MKERIAAVSAAMIAVGSFSYSSISTAEVNDFSAGIKFGTSLVSAFDDIPDVSIDEGLAIGFNVGYSFAPNWTVEFEYISGSTEVAGPARSLDVDISSTAIYAAFRSSGPVYFVGKLGVASVKLDSDIIGSGTESGVSFGVGGGYRLSPNLSFEADFTKVEDDTDWLMLSARYLFP